MAHPTTEMRPLVVQMIEHKINEMLAKKEQARFNEEADYAQGCIDGLRWVLEKYERFEGDHI